jgi:hypothetical protein
MDRLADLASLIRSKNAGPFELTFDIMFDEPAVYERVKASGALSPALISTIYRVPEEDILFFFVDNALAIKISIPRPVFQGDPLDSDSHGGQQYPPLMDIEVP